MATLTASLSLTSSAADTLNDGISFTVSKALSLAAGKDVYQNTMTVGDLNPGGEIICDVSNFSGPVYVYVKNVNATAKEVYLGAGVTTAVNATWMQLLQGEFAFFPWDDNVDLCAHAGADDGDTVDIEVMIFEA